MRTYRSSTSEHVADIADIADAEYSGAQHPAILNGIAHLDRSPKDSTRGSSLEGGHQSHGVGLHELVYLRLVTIGKNVEDASTCCSEHNFLDIISYGPRHPEHTSWSWE